MDGSIFSSAHGAVDSVVGRLTSLLVSEAQLLSGVRSEVQFISDEMESMNGFILHVAEAEYPNHQVRAWMKQIRDLACDSQDCVDQYAQCLGEGPQGKGTVWGTIRRLPWLLRTMPARHRLATRIQELKVRVAEVGDRRHRYDVTVPKGTRKPSLPVPAALPVGGGAGDDLRRRSLLDGEPPDTLQKGTELLLEWLNEKVGEQRLKVVAIFGLSGMGKTTLAHNLHAHDQVDHLFKYKAFASVQELDSLAEVLRSILKQMHSPNFNHELLQKKIELSDEKALVTMLRKHLTAIDRFLIVLDDVWSYEAWRGIKSALPKDDDCCAGSAVVLTTPHVPVLNSCLPYRTLNFFNFDSIFKFYFDRAVTLVGKHKSYLKPSLQDIIRRCYPNKVMIRMFLGILYANPSRTDVELGGLLARLDQRFSENNASQILMLCYNELPRHHQNCLLFLSIFPRGYKEIKRTSLVRRWVAEGLIARNDAAPDERDQQVSAMEVAERCFDMLVARGFVSAVTTGASGKVKSCKVEGLVYDFITRIAGDVHFVDAGVPPFLARHLSVRNRIGLQAPAGSNRSFDSILTVLEFLRTSSGLQMLRVLDLEGCKGLEKRHLKNICRIALLKYLSLRNTDVTQLPKKIKRLSCLETLDIRQTNVRELSKEAIRLPMLKHLLAGNLTCTVTTTTTTNKNNSKTDECKNNSSNKTFESFLTVNVPSGVRRMKSLEILSQVRVSNSGSDLKEIAQLMQLRKLGVVLNAKKHSLTDLINQIENLPHLHSLSIRTEGHNGDESRRVGIAETLLSPPRCLGNVITNGLPSSIQNLQKLAKITLWRTKLGKQDLHFLGNLTSLLCLRLRHKSYTESKLIFTEGEFKSLKLLVIEGSDIDCISFSKGAAPNLEKLVWTLDSSMESVSVPGIKDLPKLKELALNGDCNSTDAVQNAIREHRRSPAFRHNGQIVPQEAD
uniref:AAA+ ATPase domain-containing protein n=1 Tax=Leersia perrieri TaxID=77586 RepID=A0A0D9XUV2_9ORYZ